MNNSKICIIFHAFDASSTSLKIDQIITTEVCYHRNINDAKKILVSFHRDKKLL